MPAKDTQRFPIAAVVPKFGGTTYRQFDRIEPPFLTFRRGVADTLRYYQSVVTTHNPRCATNTPIQTHPDNC